jgi:hypothetical protein
MASVELWNYKIIEARNLKGAKDREGPRCSRAIEIAARSAFHVFGRPRANLARSSDRTPRLPPRISPKTHPNPPNSATPQKLSSLCGKNRSNDPTFHTTYNPTNPKIFGMFYIPAWYPEDIG